MTNPLALIIEDDPNLSILFTEAMRRAGFAVQTIVDGQTALTELSQLTPQVIILDLHLPKVSGKTILQYLRADDRLAQTYVILTTADPLTAETLRPLANLVLIKPISFYQLHDLAVRISGRFASEAK